MKPNIFFIFVLKKNILGKQLFTYVLSGNIENSQLI